MYRRLHISRLPSGAVTNFFFFLVLHITYMYINATRWVVDRNLERLCFASLYFALRRYIHIIHINLLATFGLFPPPLPE